MIIIGIDPSLSSTAVTIHKNNENIYYSYTNSKPNYRWVKSVNDIINFKHHEYKSIDDYSESETDKISIYDEVTDKVVEDIFNNINGEKTKIYIEGYSYSAKSGRLIDLVTFSTLLRFKLLKKSNITLYVIPPSSFKKYIAEMLYPPDKKGVYRNESGKAGGSFDKKDMMECLLKFDLDDIYFNYLVENKDEILKNKNIPKPFDDVNDSLLLVIYGLKLIN